MCFHVHQADLSSVLQPARVLVLHGGCLSPHMQASCRILSSSSTFRNAAVYFNMQGSWRIVGAGCPRTCKVHVASFQDRRTFGTPQCTSTCKGPGALWGLAVAACARFMMQPFKIVELSERRSVLQLARVLAHCGRGASRSLCIAGNAAANANPQWLQENIHHSAMLSVRPAARVQLENICGMW